MRMARVSRASPTPRRHIQQTAQTGLPGPRMGRRSRFGRVATEVRVWSPDGSKIAFMRWPDSSPNADIYVMNADGTSQVNLTNSAGVDDQCGGLSWSPDGSKIG